MKTRFLDAKNCKILLPQGRGLPLVEQLDDYLKQINDGEGPLKGTIDALINHNKKTQSTTHGSARYFNSPIEVSQVGNVESENVEPLVAIRQQPGPATYHTTLHYGDHMAWKIIIPLQFLLKWWGDANRGYQGYVHVLAHNLERIRTHDDLMARAEADSDEYYYGGASPVEIGLLDLVSMSVKCVEEVTVPSMRNGAGVSIWKAFCLSQV